MHRCEAASGIVRPGCLLLAVALSSCAPVAPDGDVPDAVGAKGDFAGLDGDRITRYLDRGFELATPHINRRLQTSPSVDFGALSASLNLGAEVSHPERFSADELDQIVSGLTHRFGETSLTTEVNELRRDHLENSGDSVYAETQFAVGGQVSVGFRSDDVQVRVAGLVPSLRLDGRVVAPYRDELDAFREQNALSLLIDRRGFALPRNVDDVRDMKPGELAALTSQGTAGLTAGVNVPLGWYGAGVVGVNASVRAALDVRLRTHMLDVQVIRMGGDEVVLDVGVRDIEQNGVQIDVVVDGWLTPVQVAAVRSFLSKRIEILRAHYLDRTNDSRLTVARLRFQLDDLDADGEQALLQAIAGDTRAAGLMAAAGRSGVQMDLELMQTARSAMASAGIDVFGMALWSHARSSYSQQLAVEHDDHIRAILTESETYGRGRLFWNTAYRQTTLNGAAIHDDGALEDLSSFYVRLDDRGEDPRPEAITQHAEGMIAAIGGDELLAEVRQASDDLLDHVDARFRERWYASDHRELNRDQVWHAVVEERGTQDLIEAKLAALRGTTVLELRGRDRSHMQKHLLRWAIGLRLVGPIVLPEIGDRPSGLIVFDLRLHDDGLTDIMSTWTGEEVSRMLASYADLDGPDDATHAVARLWNEHRRRFRAVDPEGELVLVLDPQGQRAAELSSPGRIRSGIFEELMAALFDALPVPDGVSDEPYKRRALTYLLFRLALDTGNAASYSAEASRLDGDFTAVRDLWKNVLAAERRRDPIDGGMFDIDTLIGPATSSE